MPTGVVVLGRLACQPAAGLPDAPRRQPLHLLLAVTGLGFLAAALLHAAGSLKQGSVPLWPIDLVLLLCAASALWALRRLISLRVRHGLPPPMLPEGDL